MEAKQDTYGPERGQHQDETEPINLERRRLKKALWGDERKAYDPRFIAAFGPAGGVFLSQLFHWEGKGHDKAGWIYKTEAEWKAETGLVQNQQRQARKKLREAGVLEEKIRKGLHPVNHYRINLSRLAEVLEVETAPETGPEPIEVDAHRNEVTQPSPIEVAPQLNDEVDAHPTIEVDAHPTIYTERTSIREHSNNSPTGDGGSAFSSAPSAPTNKKEEKKAPPEPTPEQLRKEKEERDLKELEEILSGDNAPARMWTHFQDKRQIKDDNGGHPAGIGDVAYCLAEYFEGGRDELECIILLQKYRERAAKEEAAS